ncbi:MAG: rhodanese-like domain-containing protein [Magnetococcales bacterium]|nr:rhodanese-like domain-containing protein [Magnetococcales bacterium]
MLMPVGALRAAEAAPQSDDAFPVKLRPSLPYVEVKLQDGKTVRVQRNQDTEASIDLDFAYVSRPCPPFCIQPMKLSPGIETIGELDVLEYLKRLSAGDDTILVIDSRTPDWQSRGMIPGAVAIPWTKLHFRHTDRKTMLEILEVNFDVAQEEDFLNFEYAKTLVFYCNGNWCGQSATNIRSLLMVGYPAHKLKWYRAGMQGWKMLGLTTVTPSGEIIEE